MASSSFFNRIPVYKYIPFPMNSNLLTVLWPINLPSISRLACLIVYPQSLFLFIPNLHFVSTDGALRRPITFRVSQKTLSKANISISTKLKLKILTKPNFRILTKIQLRNLNKTSATKYWPSFSFKISPEL